MNKSLIIDFPHLVFKRYDPSHVDYQAHKSQGYIENVALLDPFNLWSHDFLKLLAKHSQKSCKSSHISTGLFRFKVLLFKLLCQNCWKYHRKYLHHKRHSLVLSCNSYFVKLNSICVGSNSFNHRRGSIKLILIGYFTD